MRSDVDELRVKAGGLLLVSSSLIWIGSVLGALAMYASFPFRPLYVHWLPKPFSLLPVANTGFSIWYMYISELGIGPSSLIFNVGVALASIIAIPAFPLLSTLFRSASSSINLTGKVGVALFVACFFFEIGIGLCPMVVCLLHTLLGFLVFLSRGLAILLLSVVIYKDAFFSKATAIYGFLYAVLDLLFLISHLTVMEWLTFFTVSTWILLVGAQAILKVKG